VVIICSGWGVLADDGNTEISAILILFSANFLAKGHKRAISINQWSELDDEKYIRVEAVPICWVCFNFLNIGKNSLHSWTWLFYVMNETDDIQTNFTNINQGTYV
jgi:hypothetical protein